MLLTLEFESESLRKIVGEKLLEETVKILEQGFSGQTLGIREFAESTLGADDSNAQTIVRLIDLATAVETAIASKNADRLLVIYDSLQTPLERKLIGGLVDQAVLRVAASESRPGVALHYLAAFPPYSEEELELAASKIQAMQERSHPHWPFDDHDVGVLLANVLKRFLDTSEAVSTLYVQRMKQAIANENVKAAEQMFAQLKSFGSESHLTDARRAIATSGLGGAFVRDVRRNRFGDVSFSPVLCSLETENEYPAAATITSGKRPWIHAGE